MALSFVVPEAEWGKNKVVGCVESAKGDEKVFKRIEKEQGARGSKLKEYKFDMTQVEAFRYRMEDALRSVTRAAIREARVRELKVEILNSDKLKVRFAHLGFLVTFMLMVRSRLILKITHWIWSISDTTNPFTLLEFNHT